MPAVKQKYARPAHITLGDENMTLCSEDWRTWEFMVDRCDCVDCLVFIERIARLAENRRYAVS